MARDNQGLQIALIVFVMLTVVLGVTAFVFIHKCDEQDRKVKDMETTASKATADLAQKDDECKELKRLMGLPNKPLEAVHQQFKNDMESYAGNWPEDTRFYSPILHRLIEVIQKRDANLVDAKTEIEKLKQENQGLEAGIAAKIATMDKAVKDSGDQVAAVTKTAEGERQRILDDQRTVTGKIDRVHKEAKETIDKYKAEKEAAEAERNKALGKNKALLNQMDKFSQTTPDVFGGEIVEADQHSRTVTLNVGRDDGLSPQITFSVYSGDATDLGKAVKKASIEVTRIIDAHMAEARILDDKDADPIIPGDKIFTPMWAPGQRRHFALVGFLDLNNEGRNDHEGVKNLIALNGGVIDCEGDENGKEQGRITINTNYLILGEQPSEKGEPKQIGVYSHMKGEADLLHVRALPLAELKQQMGYRTELSAKKYGPVSPPARNPASRPAAEKPPAEEKSSDNSE